MNNEVYTLCLNIYYKHRHQICKAPNLCKAFFITNICRLKETGQTKYFSYNVFLTTSFSKRLSHNVVITPLPLHIRPHNVVLITSRYTRNLSLMFHAQTAVIWNILSSVTLKPQRCTSLIYSRPHLSRTRIYRTPAYLE